MPTIDLAEFVVLEGIPVLETGVSYPASTGPFSVTSNMISEAIRYTEDPHGQPPRIKIAHADNPIDADLQSLFEEMNGGRDASEPALGTILNLRADNSGQTLVGDWYGLPAWLAEILQTAYPARSIEGGAWVNEANQKSYEFMIEAVSLLGVVGPGCTSLADLQELFSNEGPKVSVIEMARPKSNNPMMGGGNPMPVVAQANVEDIRRAFYDDFAQGDRYWWWDRELLIDPTEMIVEDFDSGQLYRVPFVIAEDEHGDVTVQWGEPDPVKVQYVDDTGAKAKQGEEVAASRLIAPQLKKAGKVLAVNNNPPRKRKKEAKAAMAIDIPALRSAIGVDESVLPDDATEEQINEALAAHSSEAEASAESGDEQEEEETNEAPAERVAASSDRTVSVDRDVWEETRRGAQLAHEMARDNRRRSDEALLEQRVREGAITPASRDAYMARLAGPDGQHNAPDRESMRSYIQSLEAGVLPVQEIGHSEGETLEKHVRGTGLFPDLEAARAAAAQEA